MKLRFSKSEKRLKKRSVKWLKILGFFALCGILGFALGYLGHEFFLESINEFFNYYSFDFNLISLAIGLLLFYVVFLLHIIIHESGHLIFGLLSGYTFVSFRIGSFILVKEEGNFKMKRFSIPGTAGQCLLMPPEMKQGKYPFIIYNLGGVLFNVIVSVIGIFVLYFTNHLPFLTMMGVLFFVLDGILIAITNGIPLKVAGITNDGYNMMSMIKNEEARYSFYIQLMVNGLLAKGTRMKDMPHEWFVLTEDSDISSVSNTSIKLMEYNWYLDHGDFESAMKCLEAFDSVYEKIIGLYQNEIQCEKLFLILIKEPLDAKKVERIYNEN